MDVGTAATPAANTSTSRREFALRFEALYATAGRPSLRALAAAAHNRAHGVRGARAATISAQRISDWKAGRNVPSRYESLLPVLLVLIDTARRRGRAIPHPELLDLRRWKLVWTRAQAYRGGRATTESTCPFPGALPWAREHSACFGGRDRAIRELTVLLLDAAARTGRGRIVVLSGAAGVGKTSLLRAGLIPFLESGTPAWRVDAVDLADTAITALPELAGSTNGTPPLVVLDGVESLLRPQLTAAARDRALTEIRQLTETAVVLLSVRSDRLADCLAHPDLGEAAVHVLDGLRPDELRAAVRQAALGSGLTMEAGLEEVLTATIANHRSPSAPPSASTETAILSRTLGALWAHRCGNRLTIAGYRAIGGVEQVVVDAAEQVWSVLDVELRALARRVLLELVSVRPDADDARRRVSVHHLCGLLAEHSGSARAAELMITAGLVTVDADVACLGHDLVMRWPRLGEWIAEERPLLLRASTAVDAITAAVGAPRRGWSTESDDRLHPQIASAE